MIANLAIQFLLLPVIGVGAVLLVLALMCYFKLSRPDQRAADSMRCQDRYAAALLARQKEIKVIEP